MTTRKLQHLNIIWKSGSSFQKGNLKDEQNYPDEESEQGEAARGAVQVKYH